MSAFAVSTITGGAKTERLDKPDIQRIASSLRRAGAEVRVTDDASKKGFRNNISIVLGGLGADSPNMSCKLYFTGSIHVVGAKSFESIDKTYEYLSNVCGIPIRDTQIYMVTGSFRMDGDIDRYEVLDTWSRFKYNKTVGKIRFNPDRHPAIKIELHDGHGIVLLFRTGVVTITGRISEMVKIQNIRDFFIRFLTRIKIIRSS